MGVYLQGENWATQGPCQDGFHVPTKDELQSLYNIWVALGGATSGTGGTNFGIALKLPFAGRRNTNSNVYAQGSWGHYASAVLYGNNIYYLYFTSSNLNSPSASTATPTLGYSIRAFRNSPVVPTSSWTKMYGTSIKRGGIFRSSADGLISLSSNGNTWVTIQDKNLGATQVWNSGDTLSEANCGKYYQRGNNYGFPRTGSVTTSGTRVTISGYGPGNYYSSSTFITNSEGNPRWYNSSVDNLRGGVDGNVPTMSELKNAYIGEYKLITTSGIYHNATLGLISLSRDGSTWLTIADKNLGATTIYNFGDTINEANCGKYYQWGNNYGFPFTGSVTTSTTTNVDLSGYGPGNYYSSSVYVGGLYNNPNARGGTTGTNEAKKGPCNTGYHIPAKSERESLYNIFTSLGLSTPLQRAEYLKMPFAGGRDWNSSPGNLGQIFNQWINGRYRSATGHPAGSRNYQDGYFLDFNSSIINPGNNGNNSYGHSIRPFKNGAVQPDSSRTKLY